MSEAVVASAGSDMRSVEILSKLISFDTTSRNSNLDLIHHIADLLKGAGVDCWLTLNDDKNKANLFATVPDRNGGETGGVVLSGHTDVVPVDGQDWDSDPFKAVIRDGKLYGRGSADMKGFIAVVLSKLDDIVAAPLHEPIHFAFSFDEEVGCLGAPLMLEELVRRGVRPRGCIVGEPTDMKVVVAHKGINIHRCSVHGKSAHSSLPEKGVNSIEYAARLICFIRDIADKFKAEGPFDEYFDTPYSTAQTGMVQGGTATNVVPEECRFDFEFRNLPQTMATDILAEIQRYANETILPRMRAESPDANIAFETIASAPGLDADENAEITRLVRALAKDHGIQKVAYGTEAGQFQEVGVPSIICGPGSIVQAHRPNEFVELDQLRRCETFIDALLSKAAGN